MNSYGKGSIDASGFCRVCSHHVDAYDHSECEAKTSEKRERRRIYMSPAGGVYKHSTHPDDIEFQEVRPDDPADLGELIAAAREVMTHCFGDNTEKAYKTRVRLRKALQPIEATDE